jgi:phenylacetate-coenzyme A ligase PaaK-like adenylate-forming protein
VDKVDGIDQFRIIQERPDHIVLQLVWWREPTEHAVSELRTRMLEYLGEPVQLDVERVDSIPEEKRKFRKFISELNESTAAAPDVGHSAR